MAEIIQWAIGLLVVIQMAVMGFFASALWAHVTECRQVTARLEGIATDVERMKEDIGTHDTGMRGNLHETANRVSEHQLRIAELRRRVRHVQHKT